MKKTILHALFLLSIQSSFCQSLNDGDLLFISIQASGNKEFSLLAMKTILPNEELFLTDAAYQENGTFLGEGTLKWKNDNKNIEKGSIIEISDASGSFKSNFGEITKTGSFTPSGTDQLILYQPNSTDTTFISAINWGAQDSWISSGSTTTSNSYLPKNLSSIITFGSNKVYGKFNSPTSEISTIELKKSILNPDSWTLSNLTPLGFCSEININDSIPEIVLNTLKDGDIAFTSILTTKNKTITFVALSEIKKGQKLFFTDNALQENGKLATNEGQIIWTATSTIKEGNSIYISDTSGIYTSNLGNVEKKGSFTPSNSEQLLAFQIQNNTDTLFLAAINWGTGNSWISTGVTSTTTSYKPINLKTIVNFGSAKANGVFNCPTQLINTLQLKEEILNIKNWTLATSSEATPLPCLSIHVNQVLTISETNFTKSDLDLFPNPSKNNLVYSSTPLTNTKVYTLLGKEVEITYSNNQLDLSNLPKGCYIFTCDQGRQNLYLED